MKFRKIYIVVYEYYDTYDILYTFFNKKKAEAVARAMNEAEPNMPYYSVEEYEIEDA